MQELCLRRIDSTFDHYHHNYCLASTESLTQRDEASRQLLGCSSLPIVSYFQEPPPKVLLRLPRGRWTLDASENYQVGFRLAKALNHKQVYLISSSVPFNYDSLRKYALAHHQEWLLAAQERVDSALLESAQMSRGLERYSIFLGLTTLKPPFGRTMRPVYIWRGAEVTMIQ
jgi:Family of unknown function (DUF5694)